jgi:hypothetical protein
MAAEKHRRGVWLLTAFGGFLLAVLLLVLGLTNLAHRAEPYLRDRIIASLQDHFRGRIELDSIHLSLGNSLHGEWGVWAFGKGLRIWAPANTEGTIDAEAGKPSAGKAYQGVRQPGISPAESPEQGAVHGTPLPLIQLAEFRFHVPLRFQAGKPIHIALIEIMGLKADLPPRSHFSNPVTVVSSRLKTPSQIPSIVIDRIDCSNVQLTLETSKPGKLPQVFEISRASLSGYSSTQPAHFDADLTIPRPRGAVHSAGSFGPWLVADPGESFLDGDYRLDHGDLGVFKGIAGIVDSTGHFHGTLRDLDVVGKTSTPDFRLTHFGNALSLQTQFRAHVDGTNGDTRLESVDATLGRTHFTTAGEILGIKRDSTHAGGHDITLTVHVGHSPIEEFLRLTRHSATPLFVGTVALKTELHIGPGPKPLHERLQLNGHFVLDQARFSSPAIQSKIEQLSLRGQGHPGEVKSTPASGVSWRMESDFHLGDGILTFPALDYSVPGVDIQLQGKYGLDGGTLDFTGTAKMDATVSQMVGGWKGLLLKPADRLFRKNGAGTSVPIAIHGTLKQPTFGVQLGGMELDLAHRGGGKK